jgi:hypothetical protein
MEFDKSETDMLRKAYTDLVMRRSEFGSGSAHGDHYELVRLLRSFGCKDRFEASAQVMNYIEYAITYGKSPEVY